MAEDKPVSDKESEDKKEEKAGDAPASTVEENKEDKKEETSKVEEKKEDKKEEAPKVEEGKDVEVPAKFKKLVEEVEKMTVLELHELVKVLEKKFDVSAQATAAPAQGAAAGGDEEEKSTFTVEIKTAGDQKIAMIKAVKGILGLGLKDAKDLVDAVPSVLKEGVKKEEAEEMKKKIEEAGGTVEFK